MSSWWIADTIQAVIGTTPTRSCALHQPSATYGVNSRVLGTESISTTGPNAGFYDRATGVEICDYYRRVIEDHLLPSGKVRFLGGHDYALAATGEHLITSRLSGRTTAVRVHRRVVDGTYLETLPPRDAHCVVPGRPRRAVIPAGRLVDLAEAPAGYTVLRAGKTAMDACNWLLDNGVDPDRMRWVRPRDSWLLDRATMQPLEGVVQTLEAFALGVEAVAQADDLDDLFRRLETCGQALRLDLAVTPTMFRGATISQAELSALQQIERVVRHGKVLHLAADRIVLEDATIDTNQREVHVDCTAYGAHAAAPRPSFQPGQITLQSIMGGHVSFNAALIGFVESIGDDDILKNRLCPPIAPPRTSVDWLSMMCGGHRAKRSSRRVPEVRAWLDQSRLNICVDFAAG
jgi:hypothetical protein